MKRFLMALIFLPLATSVYAADTCTFGTVDEVGNPDGIGKKKYTVAVTCTADAGSNFQYALTATDMNIFDGRYAYTIASAGNTVSDGAEFEIRDSYKRVLLDANGNGNDFLNQASDPATFEYFSGPNADHFPLMSSNYRWTFYGENIGASGGTINLLIEFLD